MTADLSIKKVPDELVQKLRARARRNHRSMQGELLAILEEALRPSRMTVRKLREQVGRLDLRTGDEATAMVREDRDAR